jgi:hypothetical protein
MVRTPPGPLNWSYAARMSELGRYSGTEGLGARLAPEVKGLCSNPIIGAAVGGTSVGGDGLVRHHCQLLIFSVMHAHLGTK